MDSIFLYFHLGVASQNIYYLKVSKFWRNLSIPPELRLLIYSLTDQLSN